MSFEIQTTSYFDSEAKRIRKMESAWVKVNQSKFRLIEYQDKKGELRPYYQLTKTECLYIATKFNDEARAKLVLRWEELERDSAHRGQSPCALSLVVYRSGTVWFTITAQAAGGDGCGGED